MTEKILSFKNMLCAAAGAVGGVISALLGGWSEDMTTLIIFMITDFVTGLILAAVFRKSNKTADGALHSKAGFYGLCKKCVMLLFVLIAHRLDMALGVGYIRTVTVIGFTVNEAISIIENAGMMGVPIPEKIKNAIELLKERDE